MSLTSSRHLGAGVVLLTYAPTAGTTSEPTLDPA